MMQVWGQEGTRGWAEKVAGPGQGELEQGLKLAANRCDLQQGRPSQCHQLGCLQQLRDQRCRRDVAGHGVVGTRHQNPGEDREGRAPWRNEERDGWPGVAEQ